MTTTPPPRTRREPNIRAFDFLRPDKLNREHLRALQVIHENFTRALATQLASTLRANVQISTGEMRQLKFEDYIAELENPAFMALLAMPPLPGAALLYLPTSVSLALVELSLGAGEASATEPRVLSDIERELLKQVARRATTELQNAFAPIVEIEPRVAAVEANPAFVQIAAPSDTVVVTEYQFALDGLTASGNLCMPFTTLQPVMEELSKGSLFTGESGIDPIQLATRMSENLAGVVVDVTAEFRPVTLTPGEIVSLGVGHVIPLAHPVDAPLVLRVNGIPVYSVKPGANGRRTAVSLTGLATGTKERR